MTSALQHRFAVGDAPRLDVDIVSGEVRLRNGEAGTITVTIDAADPAQITLTQAGDTISVLKPAGWANRRRSVVVTAVVPPGTDVTVNAASADIRLDGRYGNARLRTISGDVTVDRIERGDVGSTSGDFELGTTGSLEASTVSGDVEVGHVQGRLRASLTSGDLRADLVDGDAEVATMSGDIQIRRCDGGEINLRSVSGDVRLGLPTGVRVEPEISTVSGSTSLPKGAPSAATEPRRRVRLRLKTVSGDIRLDRA